jgi:acyl-coenzyme A thioesterase PaaI-like protein
MEPSAGDARCFGCGPDNEAGMHLDFRQTGTATVECTYVVPAHLCGGPTTVHGGIQATILDEALGKAAHIGFADGPRRRIVTAEFSLRYRRPAPLGEPLTARAELVRVEGPNVFVRGALLGPDGGELTTAEARWKVTGLAEE